MKKLFFFLLLFPLLSNAQTQFDNIILRGTLLSRNYPYQYGRNLNGLMTDWSVPNKKYVDSLFSLSGTGSGSGNYILPTATSSILGGVKIGTGVTISSGVISSTPAWGAVTGKPTFATVATSGSYADLSNKPTIPTQFNPIAGTNITLSGTYPNITFSATGTASSAVAWADVTGKPTFATVSTSGSYNDLTNKPSIPAQVALSAGNNVTITGTYPNLTIASTSSSSGSSSTPTLDQVLTAGNTSTKTTTVGGLASNSYVTATGLIRGGSLAVSGNQDFTTMTGNANAVSFGNYGDNGGGLLVYSGYMMGDGGYDYQYNKRVLFNFSQLTSNANRSYLLPDVSGTIQLVSTSDIRLKDVIAERLPKAPVLTPITFRYKADNKRRTHYGYSAQEVRKYFPELVGTEPDEMLGEHYTLDYTELHTLQIVFLLKELERLKEELKSLKSSK